LDDFLFVASKIFWGAVQPTNLLTLLTIAAPAAVLLKAGRRFARGLSVSLLVMVLTFAVLPVDDWLMAPLEHRFPPRVPEISNPPDAIIVLGGVIDPVKSAKSGVPAIGNGAERITEMLYLAQRYPSAKVIFSGGSGRLTDKEYREGDAVRDLVERIGLPISRFGFESEARNTIENALYVSKLFPPDPDKTLMLVTSAFHMPRSVGVFRRIGFNVLPYPVDYMTEKDAVSGLGFDMAGGLSRSSVAMKEWVGLTVYRVLGRTDSWFPAP
jgi:uncharacterized SAM-binding protein YcdF (DUF218 family)